MNLVSVDQEVLGPALSGAKTIPGKMAIYA